MLKKFGDIDFYASENSAMSKTHKNGQKTYF